MLPATSVDEFIARPAGRTYAQRTFMFCAPSAERICVVHLASLEPSEVPLVAPLVKLPNSPGLAPRYDLYYDVSPVEAMDRATFALYETFVRSVIDILRTRVRRFALVKTNNIVGVLFSGMFHDWIAPQLGDAAQMFDARAPALDWLGVPDGERATLVRTIDAFVTTTPLVRRLREALAEDLRDPSVAVLAARLATSARSLQRHLGEVGTSFREELLRARIRAAQTLLAESKDKIESIAVSLGFKSPATFITWFGEVIGESPAVYRERRRA